MKLTIKPNANNIKVKQLVDGVEIEFDEFDGGRAIAVELWLDNEKDELEDYKRFFIKNTWNKNKMVEFKGFRK